MYDTSSYLNVGGKPAEVFTINKGKAQGTMFKIDTGGYIFSSLFDSGAEISCMNIETCAALGLTDQTSNSSITVNIASRQNMGVAGSVWAKFKIGQSHSFTHNFIVCECLSRPLIVGEDFLS